MKRIFIILAVLSGCAAHQLRPHHLMAAAGTTLTANQVSFFRGNPDPPTPGSVAIVSTDGINLLQQNSDGTTQAIGGGGSAGTVTSVGSADGSVVVTNPTTTPDLSVRTLSAATPAALAAINVNTNPSTVKTGSMAFVTAMQTGGGPGVYVLQPAISTTPDSFYVIATADDAARQWVFSSIHEQGDLVIMTLPLDLTAPQTVTLLPPVGYIYQNVQFATWVVTAKDGTVTTGPTAQMGTNAGINDLAPSTVQTGVIAQAVGGQSAITGGVAGNGGDMTTNGIRLQITVGAVLGTATVFKARLRINVGFVKI